MKTIALIDHYSAGHHFAFIRLFAKYFLKNGYRVCIFYPERENEIRIFLEDEGFASDLVLFEKTSLQKKVIPGNGYWQMPISTLRFWRDTKRTLQHAERKYNLKFDFVFFAWLDDYLCNYLHHFFVDALFRYKWSGLYFHPWYLNAKDITNRVSFSSVDAVLLSKNCVSVAIHDEFNLKTLTNRIGKKVVLFPEIADSTPPQIDYVLAQEIKSKANGRTVVGLVGISYRKGFPVFLETIEEANPDKFFFFFSGILETEGLSQNQTEKIQNFLQAVPSNCFYYPNYLEEGAKLNAVIDTFDVLFLVYNKFQSSSNFITKAALFKKAVISTNRFWMGRVTLKYKLGLVSEEGDAVMVCKALEEIESGKSELHKRAQWQEYLSVHDEKKLLTALREVLA